MRQCALVPAGNHANYCGAITDGSKYFAYCSNLSIYVSSLDSYRLERIVAGYEQTITCIDWNPHAPLQLVACSLDGTVSIWDVPSEVPLQTLKFESTPLIAQFCRLEKGKVAVVSEDGVVRLWNTDKNASIVVRDFNFSPVQVLRWSHKRAHHIATGHEDSSLVFYNADSQKSNKIKCADQKNGGHSGGVQDLQWDPLSDTYCLASFGSGVIALFDCDTKAQIRQFEKQSGGVGCLEWLPGQPGSFLAASNRHGSIRQWNVSQATPEKSFKVGQGGLRSVRGLADGERILVAGVDGSVGVYHMGRRQWVHETVLSHSETIFTCEFKRSDKNVVATGSFDGTVKLWDVARMAVTCTMSPGQGVIYCIAWPPNADDERLACSTSQGKVLFFSTAAEKLGAPLGQVAVHKDLVYNIAWSSQPDLLASAGSDGAAVLFSPDGATLVKIPHPGGVFDVDFTFHGGSELLATTCNDGTVRLFNVDEPKSFKKMHELRGHKLKAFGVKFSPIVPGLLASSSDDRTVCVWRLDGEVERPTVLKGHVEKTRALAWHHEVPHILLSGSWDGCIRVWDVRGEGTCLRVAMDHHADVYGLSSHPERPFFFVSSSRDTTLRFWSVEMITADLYFSSLLSLDLAGDQLTADPLDVLADPAAPPKLCGAVSRRLAKELSASSSALDKFKKLAAFLVYPEGAAEFANIVQSYYSKVPLVSDDRIFHSKNVIQVMVNEAQRLEKTRGTSFAGIGRMSKDEALRKAASIYVRLGYIRQYCDIMVEVGEWDKAVMAAPAVSVQYWRELAGKHAARLAEQDDGSCTALMVAAGQHAGAADQLVEKGDLDGAMMIAQVAHQKGFAKVEAALQAKPPAHAAPAPETPAANGEVEGEAAGEAAGGDGEEALRGRTVGRLRDHYMRQGKPLLAACCHLAVGDEQAALQTLVQGHEVELAAMLCNLRGGGEGAEEVYRLAAMKLEALQNFNAARACLQRCTTAGATEQFEQMSARRAIRQSEEATDQIYAAAGLPALAALKKQVEDAKGAGEGAEGGKALVRTCVLAKEYATALEKGFGMMRECVAGGAGLAEARGVSKWLCCISLLDMEEEQRLRLMTFESFFAAQDAIGRDYATVVSPLFNFARDRAGRLKNDPFPVTIAEMVVQEAAYHTSNGALPPKTMELLQSVIGETIPASEAVREKARALLSKGLESPSGPRGGVRGVLPYGWVIPSAACRRAGVRSFISGGQIQGPEFWLNQLTPDAPAAAISLADAAQWTRCCAFSPTGDGQILLSP